MQKELDAANVALFEDVDIVPLEDSPVIEINEEECDLDQQFPDSFEDQQGRDFLENVLLH